MKIIYKDGVVAECPQEEELHVLRHTAAHIMAQAIKRLYPQADFAFGPATENGFYYDVDLGDTKLSDEDLANIEKEMKKICKENLPIKPFILPRDEAVKLMNERQEFLPRVNPCRVQGLWGRACRRAGRRSRSACTRAGLKFPRWNEPSACRQRGWFRSRYPRRPGCAPRCPPAA